ncbi:hypothetical protein GUJ93_ZPchr0009g1014 [Zizania palustris]|uniref:Uncharacterized protein n=1 Tax=Zizania palustris TaxID=103762 RepID=A0A8J5V2X4_ZIZPA|nr:hypothetical protein GUJ93_ZPchr0009g1014 [Zizania palustris]
MKWTLRGNIPLRFETVLFQKNKQTRLFHLCRVCAQFFVKNNLLPVEGTSNIKNSKGRRRVLYYRGRQRGPAAGFRLRERKVRIGEAHEGRRE